jgi:hypothetical protein
VLNSYNVAYTELDVYAAERRGFDAGLASGRRHTVVAIQGRAPVVEGGAGRLSPTRYNGTNGDADKKPIDTADLSHHAIDSLRGRSSEAYQIDRLERTVRVLATASRAELVNPTPERNDLGHPRYYQRS